MEEKILTDVEMVESLTNDDLRTLLKETHELGKLVDPWVVPMSPLLKRVFDIDGYWPYMNRIQKTKRVIENEILYRVRTNSF